MVKVSQAEFAAKPDRTDPSRYTFIADVRVRRIGYGAALRVVDQPGTPRTSPDAAAVKRVLRRAVELGVMLIDTADSYGPEVSETLVADALHPYPAEVLISTKGGVVRDGMGRARLDGRPEQLRMACDASLRRLRLDTIGLYHLHWPDPAVPFADQVGTLADLVRAGKVRHIGLCNIDVDQLAAASRVTPIAAVQHRFGLGEQTETPLLEACGRHGTAFIAYGSLSVLRTGPAHLSGRLRSIAARHQATPAQVALAWLLRHAAGALVIPGTLSLQHLEENMQAGSLRLTDSDMAELARDD